MTEAPEPQPGDRVRFRGSSRTGTVVQVITAGRPNGAGVYRLRRRAQIRYQSENGEWWETHRDLDEIEIVPTDPQGNLF